MFKIKVFGTIPPCIKCKKMEQIAREVASKFEGKVEVEKVDIMSDEVAQFGILFSPSVAINNTVVSNGKVMSVVDLEKALLKVMEG